jgi:DNA-directed RNA polymerase subunit alpha
MEHHIPLPTSVRVERASEHDAVMILEPFYPGYGTTIGNALRRVLLSSMPGSAITSVKIKGVQHEFSTIDHIKEDVVGIILNLKLVRVKLLQEEPTTLKLKVKGEKKVTVGDFEANSVVEVMNPDQHLATLTSSDASLEMEVTIENGMGYRPVEAREKEKLELGNIAIDAIFTPVRTVNFKVENVRVGQMTNYERVDLHVVTDGIIDPEAAFRNAVQILLDHFQHLQTLGQGPAVPLEEPAEPEAQIPASEASTSS